MKISQKLPQFNEKHTLVVTMGNHHGIVYKVMDGEVEKIEELRIEQPQYSDNEGSFRQGGSNNISFGSVLEPKKGEYEHRFSKEIADKVWEYFKQNKVDQIFLFRPKDIDHLIERDWHNDLKKITLIRFDGNHVSGAPNELLETIKNKWESDSKTKPTGVAKKILDKFLNRK